MTTSQSVHPDVQAMRDLLAATPAPSGGCADCQQRSQLIRSSAGIVQSIAPPRLQTLTTMQPIMGGSGSVDLPSLSQLYADDMTGVCTPCTTTAPTYYCGPLESSSDLYTSGSLIACHVYATCDLQVDGPTTLNGDLAVSGNTTLAGTLTVGGKTVGGVLTGLNQMIRGDASGNEVAIAAPATAGLVLGYNGSSIAWVAGATAGSGTSGVNSNGGLQLYPTSGNLVSGYAPGTTTNPTLTITSGGSATFGNSSSEGDMVIYGQLSVLPQNPLADGVIVNAVPGFASNLQIWKVNGATQASLDQNGNLAVNGLTISGSRVYPFGATQTTAPSAGTADALPALPAGYVAATLSDGTPVWLAYYPRTVAAPTGSSSPGIFSPGVASPGHA